MKKGLFKSYSAKFISFALVIFLSACTMGTSVLRPDSYAYVLGVTSYQDIINKYGKPIISREIDTNDVKIKHLYYGFGQLGGGHEKDMGGGRWTDFYFSEGKLIGYKFRSSLEEDHTDFDESLRSQIKKNIDDRNKVIALYGPPNGEYIYPLIENKNHKAHIYSYSYVIVPFMGKNKHFSKQLVFTLDENNIVIEIEFAQQTN